MMIIRLPTAAKAMNEGMQVLWDDAERVLCRGRRAAGDCTVAVLVASTAAEQPGRPSLDRLAHEYSLKDELDSRWAIRPLELLHDNGRMHLVSSLGISHTLDLPASARRKCLRTIRPMLLRADNRAEPVTLEEFCKRPHIVVSSMGNATDETDQALSLLGRRRKVVLAVPQFSALPRLLAQSEVLAIVPDYVARAMALAQGIRAEAVPLPLPTQSLSMVWPGAAHNDAGQRWLRWRCQALLGTPIELRVVPKPSSASHSAQSLLAAR